MTKPLRVVRLASAGLGGLMLLTGGQGRAAEDAPSSDPARVVAENAELEAEIRLLERRWIDGANADKELARALSNHARVIEQQRAVIADVRRARKDVPAPSVAASAGEET